MRNIRSYAGLFYVSLIFIYMLAYQRHISDTSFTIYVYALRTLIYIASLVTIFVSIAVKRKLTRTNLFWLCYLLIFLLLATIHGQGNLSTINSIVFFPLFCLAIGLLDESMSIADLRIVSNLSKLFFILSLYEYINTVLIQHVTQGHVINTIYFPVAFLLTTCILSMDKVSFVGSIICLILCVYVGKNTPIVSIIMLYVAYTINFISSRFGTKFILPIALFYLSFLIMLLLIFVISSGLLSSAEINTLTSGRAYLVENVIEDISNFGIFSLLFGEGFGAVSKIYGISSHNDFLEVLFSFGLIGLTLYVAFYGYLFLSAYKAVIVKNYYLASMRSAILLLVVLSSLSSHFIFIPSYLSLLVLCSVVNLRAVEGKSNV